jgi:hypothetical protein
MQPDPINVKLSRSARTEQSAKKVALAAHRERGGDPGQFFTVERRRNSWLVQMRERGTEARMDYLVPFG